MISLTREVRCHLNPGSLSQTITNSWGGWPSANSISPGISFRCTLLGEIDPISGYLCNIKLVDDVIRKKVIEQACVQFNDMTFESLTLFALKQIGDEFPENCRVEKIQLSASPTLRYTVFARRPDMIQLSQQFEFSASHRLHNPDLTDDQNVQLFGKCNNPHGHGHNYVVMVTIEGLPDENGILIPVDQFEGTVKQDVIDRLDHRYLNIELEEFRTLNPSVENIAIVIWNLLEAPLKALGNSSARLSRVRVYETPKTWAEYTGGDK